jgi:DNA-binding CsgD family transcriptional regulator
VRTIKAGAEDFLTKPVSSEQLLLAIEKAMAHHQASRGQRQKLDALRELLGTLTPRERQVFERVVHGKINKQIARELGATERTIKAHRQRVMEKIKVRSLAEAERLGILAAGPAGKGSVSCPHCGHCPSGQLECAGRRPKSCNKDKSGNWIAAERSRPLQSGGVFHLGDGPAMDTLWA